MMRRGYSMIQGQVIDGRFECRGTTSRAEPGEAWFAWDGDHEVVLRVLPGIAGEDAARDAFMLAAGSAAKLNRDSVERVIHAGITDDRRAYVVTEKVSGRTLAEELSTAQHFDVQRALGVAAAVAGALADAATHGICHGRLSPAVIMLGGGASRKGRRRTAGNRIKVTGFAPWEITQPPTVFNREYAAPEVKAGGVPDIRSDCWSLGAILYRMLTGSIPETTSGGRGRGGRQHARIRPPSAVRAEAGITAQIDLLVLRLLENDPARRLDATEQLVTHIKSIMNGESQTTEDDPDTAATVVADMPPAAIDTIDGDIDEGISFASGHKVRTTSFSAPTTITEPAAPTRLTDATGSFPGPLTVAAPERAPVTVPTATPASPLPARPPRGKNSSVVAVVVLVGFFVLAAIAVTGWFVLQYQSRQLELARAAAAPATQVVAPVTPAPAPAAADGDTAAPVAPAVVPTASATVPAPVETAVGASSARTAEPAPAPAPVQAARQPGAVVSPASAPAVKVASSAPPTASKPVAGARVDAAASTTTTNAATTRPPVATTPSRPTREQTAAAPVTDKANAAKKKTAANAARPNWDDGLDSGEIEPAPKPKTPATAPKTESTGKPSLDWGD